MYYGSWVSYRHSRCYGKGDIQRRPFVDNKSTDQGNISEVFRRAKASATDVFGQEKQWNSPLQISQKWYYYRKKTRFSAFIEGSSDINQQLRSHEIDNVLISGVATNVCCEATARDAMMLNYNTTMISDALAAMTPEAHENSLRSIYGLFTDVQTVAEVIEKLI